jgi:hypothetical protein
LESDSSCIDPELFDGHNLLVSLVPDVYTECFELIDKNSNFVFVIDGAAVSQVFKTFAA